MYTQTINLSPSTVIVYHWLSSFLFFHSVGIKSLTIYNVEAVLVNYLKNTFPSLSIPTLFHILSTPSFSLQHCISCSVCISFSVTSSSAFHFSHCRSASPTLLFSASRSHFLCVSRVVILYFSCRYVSLSLSLSTVSPLSLMRPAPPW